MFAINSTAALHRTNHTCSFSCGGIALWRACASVVPYTTAKRACITTNLSNFATSVLIYFTNTKRRHPFSTRCLLKVVSRALSLTCVCTCCSGVLFGAPNVARAPTVMHQAPRSSANARGNKPRCVCNNWFASVAHREWARTAADAKLPLCACVCVCKHYAQLHDALFRRVAVCNPNVDPW